MADPIAGRLFSSVLLLLLASWFNIKKYLPRASSDKLEELIRRIKKGAIAHRGGIPENTINAFRSSKSGKASTVEVDLQFTKDGQPVLFHDYEVDRVSDRSGDLTDYTLEEIQSLDVGHKFGFDNAKVPTLYESIEALHELDMNMFLEIKSIDNKDTAKTVAEMFKKDPSLYNRIVVISFFPHILYELKQLDSNIVVGLCLQQTTFTEPKCNQKWKQFILSQVEKVVNWYLKMLAWRLTGTGFILPDKNDILEGRFDYEHYQKQGLHIVTWTVNSKDEQEYFHNHNLLYMTDHVL